MQQVGITTFVLPLSSILPRPYIHRYIHIYVVSRHPISFGWFVRESNEKTNRWSVRFASYIPTAPLGHESIQVLGPGPGYIYIYFSEPSSICVNHVVIARNTQRRHITSCKYLSA